MRRDFKRGSQHQYLKHRLPKGDDGIKARTPKESAKDPRVPKEQQGDRIAQRQVPQAQGRIHHHVQGVHLPYQIKRKSLWMHLGNRNITQKRTGGLEE
jgi:hypothetical protein